MTQLDPKRIDELERVMGDQLESTLASLERSIAGSIAEIEMALAPGNLAEAAYAAHHSRNDVLIVGAAALQCALSDLEAACRRGELSIARACLTRVLESWPAARAEIRSIAGQRRTPG